MKLAILLAVSKLSHGTVDAQATAAVHETLQDWNLTDGVVGMSFDTTSSNSAIYKAGACV